MSIAQAMGMRHGRPAGFAYLQAFVAQAKASGFVADALRASGNGDVPVPAA
jgi:polar amino acid transport system substrate-binding protein